MSTRTLNLPPLDRAICGEIYASDAAAHNLERLCQECSGRFAGSDDYRRAAEMVAEWWRACGLSDVHLEPFPFTAWARGSATLTLTAPSTHSEAVRCYPCLALPYAPACDLEAEVIDLGFGLEADFTRAGTTVKGRMAMVKNGAPGGQRGMHRLQKYALALAAGAAAFIFVDDQPGMLPPTGSLVFIQDGPLDQALPSVGIPYEAGLDLARWAKSGAPLRLHLRLDNRVWRAESWNVVGDLARQEPDGPFIVVGGHLDGHDIAQGAIDNASGIVAITEIARALAPHREQLRHTVRFIAFGVEELGMLGSHAYAEQHLTELERLRFVFNLDCVGTGNRVGFGLQDCGELATYFREMGQQLAADMDVGEYLVPFSDQFPFTLQGLPSAFIHTSGDKGPRGWGHTSADTLDKVSVQAIRLAAATTARMVLRVASGNSAWPGRRRSPDEVKSMLQTQGAEPLMRAQGVWPFA